MCCVIRRVHGETVRWEPWVSDLTEWMAPASLPCHLWRKEGFRGESWTEWPQGSLYLTGPREQLRTRTGYIFPCTGFNKTFSILHPTSDFLTPPAHLPTPVQGSALCRTVLGKTSSWPGMKLFSKAAGILKRKTVTVEAVFQTGVFLYWRSLWLCIFSMAIGPPQPQSPHLQNEGKNHYLPLTLSSYI